MSTQAPFRTTPEIQTWVALLRAHATSIRRFNAELVSEHGLTLNDYEVLLRLARAPERRMRRVDLAQQVLLTASGITRLLDGLEGHGYVARAACDSDRRVVYAVLTDEGAAKLREASSTHVVQIEDYFTSRYDVAELSALAALLGRIDAGADAGLDCTGD